jgi:dTDP-glucose 4,6-dehydratase
MMSSSPEPVNIGNPHEMTMLEFAEEIIRATKSRSKIVFRPLPQDDPRQRQPDINRARTLLNWEPCITLAEGLAKTIGYFEHKLLGGGRKGKG